MSEKRTRRSVAAFVWSSRLPPFDFPYWTATSINRPYLGIPAAARIKEGFVVESYTGSVGTGWQIDVNQGNLRFVDTDSCEYKFQRWVREINTEEAGSHSKSPESQTRTVPVCLRWSREVVMRMARKKIRNLIGESMNYKNYRMTQMPTEARSACALNAVLESSLSRSQRSPPKARLTLLRSWRV